MVLCPDLSATDTWMEKLIKKKHKKGAQRTGYQTLSSSIGNLDSDDNPFEEITRWFRTKRLDRLACPNPIAWWGVSKFSHVKTVY